MITALVGYTGFVGSNLLASNKFDAVYNSKNISESFGTKPDILVYAGVPSEMFLANSFPEKDLDIIENAIENIIKIMPKKLILISTVAVYSELINVDENTSIDKNKLNPYGLNRLYLEEWVEKNISDYIIIRLPALYGKNLKKNFIYDYINFIPKLLRKEKYEELVEINKDLEKYYFLQNNGYYKCIDLNEKEKKKLITIYKNLEFSAINFTDSRNQYQFYNLKYLWEHICLVSKMNIKKINLVTEPIRIDDLYYELEKHKFSNIISEIPIKYDIHTIYSNLFDGNNYIMNNNEIKKDLKQYILNEKKRLNNNVSKHKN